MDPNVLLWLPFLLPRLLRATKTLSGRLSGMEQGATFLRRRPYSSAPYETVSGKAGYSCRLPPFGTPAGPAVALMLCPETRNVPDVR